MPIAIPNTLGVVVDCWMRAETALREVVKEKHHDLDEECVTTLFYGELGCALRKASHDKVVERAFLSDLCDTFWQTQFSETLESCATNLIAEVVLHKRETEKFTGGDFGLTLVRPVLSSDGAWTKDERGLLCQAKIKRRSGKWGPLSTNQEQVLSNRTNYLALLLYSYSDSSRQCLDAFKWQLCRGMTVHGVKKCLTKNTFPSLIDSKEVIEQLGNASAGTNDPRTLDEIVRPTGTPHLEVQIFWPEAKVPPPLGLQHLIGEQLEQRIQR